MSLTAKRLRELVIYNPATGLFFHAKPVRGVKPGSVCGYVNNHGRRLIGIDQVKYGAARLAILYMTGEMPAPGMDVDHIDGDCGNDRYSNLRVISHQANIQNQVRAHRRIGRSSRFLGVNWKKDKEKWGASISTKGKSKHLGYFDDEEAAGAAYLQAKRQLHEGCTI